MATEKKSAKSTKKITTSTIKPVVSSKVKSLANSVNNLDLRIDRNDKRKVFFVRKVSGTCTVLKIKNVKSSAEMMNFGKGKRRLKFKIDINRPTYRIRNIFVYFIDIQEGQLTFENNQNDISPEMLDMILNRSIVKQLVSVLESPSLASMLMYLLMAIGLGGCIGYIIGNAFPM